MDDRAGHPRSRLTHSVQRFGKAFALLLLMLSLVVPTTLIASERASFAATPEASRVATREASPVANRVAGSTPAVDTRDPRLATIKTELRDQVSARIGDDLSSYAIVAALRVGQRPGIDGTESIDYVNTTGGTLTTLPFRLYANGADEDIDSVVVDDVTVDGTAVEPELTVANSVMTLPLPEPLVAGGKTTISLSFSATLPIDTSDHYGIFGIDTATGSWALAHWYPIVAGWDPANGWELDPTSVNGDPIFSNTALYDVTISTPDTWAVVTTGSVIENRLAGPAGLAGSERTRRFLTGPVRDFTIVADSDFESTSTVVDGTVVKSWFNPGTEQVGRAVLTYAAKSLALYNSLIGPYPYIEFDVVPVELYGAAGVEFPQMIYIGQSYYAGDQVPSEPSYLDFTVAHEVLHQWWYGLVGNNQYIHAFTDEGLTNFISSKVYFTRVYNADYGDRTFDDAAAAPFKATVARGEDQIVDQPTDDFPSERAYVYAAYSKAPMGFSAIYNEIGDKAFFEALHAYYQKFEFGIAQPDDLLAAFEKASGKDLHELWDHWFQQAAGKDDI